MQGWRFLERLSGRDLSVCKACRFYPQDSEKASMGFQQGRDMVRMSPKITLE